MLTRDTIFVMDASPSSRAALRKTFERKFNILEASTLSQAEVLLRQSHGVIAAIVVDMHIISQNKRNSLSWFLENPDLQNLPIIALVDQDDEENEERAFQLDFTDIIFRPIHSLASRRRVSNLIEIYRRRWQLENKVDEQERALRNANEAIVDTMAALIEGRSLESGQHVMRLRRFTRILLDEIAAHCPEYGLTDDSINAISSAAALHDIGKIAIPDVVLNKPGRLTPEEYEIMKTHAEVGSEILAEMTELGSSEYMKYAYNICRYHHERWDGGGYPEGLSGEEIPICAQVVGLVDCYDALTTDRVYKKATTHAQAVGMIINGECGAFSPVLLTCFKSVHSRLQQAALEYAEGSSPKNDDIRAPLAQPAPAAVDSLNKLLTKYDAMLRYIDATVVDVDLDKKVYHMVYNSNPELEFLNRVSDQKMDLVRFAGFMANSEGENQSPEMLMSEVESFLKSGQRQKTFYGKARHRDGSLHSYELTVICPIIGIRLVTLVCKEIPEGGENSKSSSAAAIHSLPVQLCLLDNSLTMPSVGTELLKLLDYDEQTLKEACGGRFAELVPHERREHLLGEIRTQLSHSSKCSVEMPLIGRNGATVWVSAKGFLGKDGDENETVSFLFADITESYRIRDKLRRDLERQELILAQSEDITFEMDFKTDILTCSPKWEERFGYAPISENLEKRLEEESHFHPDDVPVITEKIAEMKNGVPFVEASLRIADSQGKYQWNVMRASLVSDEEGKPHKGVGVFIDIGEEVQAARGKESGADRDQLTGLLNKQTCRRRIEEWISRSKSKKLSALAIIDLDDFKEINDRYGHLFGDNVLAQVAAEIDKNFRGTDIVGRIGGDEFLVFMPDIKKRKLVEGRFNQLIDTLSNLLKEHLDENQKLSCTVGISFYPENGNAYEELFQAADRALYSAKKSGKGCYRLYGTDGDDAAYDGGSMIRTRIDSEDSREMQYSTMLEYVFRRLYASGDTLQTIDEVLALVGESLGVSRVYIFENNRENTTCSNTFEWCNEGVEPQIHILQNISYEDDLAGYRESFNEQGVLYAPDITQLPRHIRDIVEPQGIKSMLQCAIRENGKFLGYVGLDDNDRIRLWTKEQIDVLTTLAHILSVFLLKYRMHTQARELVGNLHQLLNRLPGYLYVTDPETYRLRFFNENLRSLEPDVKVGDYCYKAFKGQNRPCEGCPISAENHCCRIRNEKHGLELSATAGDIVWEGRKAWFVSCQRSED